MCGRLHVSHYSTLIKRGGMLGGGEGKGEGSGENMTRRKGKDPLWLKLYGGGHVWGRQENLFPSRTTVKVQCSR